MKPEDYIGEPCGCEACTVAGVSDRPTRRDPWTGRVLHGRELRRWYEAKATFEAWTAKVRAGMSM